MTDFVAVTDASELPPGEMKRVKVGGRRVCLANVEGEFYALRDECGHQRAPLSKGRSRAPWWSVRFASRDST